MMLIIPSHPWKTLHPAKKRFMVYGNCWTHVLAEYLLSAPSFAALYQYIQIEPAVNMTDMMARSIFPLLPELDLFIFTPAYKDDPVKNTRVWLDRLSAKAMVIGLSRCRVETQDDISMLERREALLRTWAAVDLCLDVSGRLKQNADLLHRPQHPTHVLLSVLATDILLFLGLESPCRFDPKLDIFKTM